MHHLNEIGNMKYKSLLDVCGLSENQTRSTQLGEGPN